MTKKTSSTNPRPPRRRNPAWNDPKEARAARQAKRQEVLNEIARASGFDSWSKLATAAMNGQRIVLNEAADEPLVFLSGNP